MRIVFVLVATAALSSACGAVESESPPEPTATAHRALAPDFFFNDAGVKFIRKDPITLNSSDEPEVLDVTDRVVTQDPYSLTVEQLAEKLKAVTTLDGYWYEQETPDLVLAQAVLDNQNVEQEGPAAIYAPVDVTDEDSLGYTHCTSSTSGPAECTQGVIIADDNRTKRNDTDKYPWSAIAAYRTSNSSKASCTGTIIGHAALLTSAHCLYQGNKVWRLNRWVPGADQDDGPAGDEPFGAFSCYTYYIPKGFIEDRDDDLDLSEADSYEYDFAIIDFSWGGCNVKVGRDITGYLGYSSKKVDPEETRMWMYGYPGDKNPNPTLWGMGRLPPTVDDNFDDWEEEHYLDAKAGQSGSGVWWKKCAAGCRRVAGVHAWESIGDWVNGMRRVDSTVVEFIRKYSSL